jgi:hypothetical protein
MDRSGSVAVDAGVGNGASPSIISISEPMIVRRCSACELVPSPFGSTPKVWNSAS